MKRLAVLLAVSLIAKGAIAQSYPSKPITLVVPLAIAPTLPVTARVPARFWPTLR